MKTENDMRRYLVIQTLSQLSELTYKLAKRIELLTPKDKETFFEYYPKCLPSFEELPEELSAWYELAKEKPPENSIKETPEPASWNASPAELQEEAEDLDWDQKPLELESDE